MTGTINMVFHAETIGEAKLDARTRWRKIVDDDTAELPWDTEFEITWAEMSGMDDTLVVKVSIELDTAEMESMGRVAVT